MIHAWPRGNSIYSTAGKYPRIALLHLASLLGCFSCVQETGRWRPSVGSASPLHWKVGDAHGISRLLSAVTQVPNQSPLATRSLLGALFNVINDHLCGFSWTCQGHLISTFAATHHFFLHLQYSRASCRVLRKGSLQNLTFQQHFTLKEASSAQLWSQRDLQQMTRPGAGTCQLYIARSSMGLRNLQRGASSSFQCTFRKTKDEEYCPRFQEPCIRWTGMGEEDKKRNKASSEGTEADPLTAVVEEQAGLTHRSGYQWIFS